jgi:hypothetical protein
MLRLSQRLQLGHYLVSEVAGRVTVADRGAHDVGTLRSDKFPQPVLELGANGATEHDGKEIDAVSSRLDRRILVKNADGAEVVTAQDS